MKYLKKKPISFLAGRWPINKKIPTILMIHGAGQSGIFWKNQLFGLLPLVNTIAINIHDNDINHKHKINNIVKLTLKTINNINLKNSIICGFSMGGAIAQHIMLHNSKLFKAGILINTGARLKVLPSIIKLIKNDYNKYKKTFLKLSIAKNNLNNTIINNTNACFNNKPNATVSDFKLCNNFDEMQVTKYIKIPTLIVTANEDILTPPKYGYYLANQIKSSIHINIKNAGHMLPIERPKIVNTIFSNFLSSIMLSKTLKSI